MKIIIVGAGIAGRALYRFLELQGRHDIEIYDIENKTRCGLHPCAWAVKTSDFIEMHKYLELPRVIKSATASGTLSTKPRLKILNRFTKLNLDGDMIKCELCTIDKPQFLEQMCRSTNIKYGFDIDQVTDDDTLVVDATGEQRALLPPLKHDMKITCKQSLYHTDQEDLDIAMYHSGEVGYAWSFPLDNGLVHIGQGSMDWSEYDRQAAKSKSKLKYFPPETRRAMYDAGVLYAGIETKPVCKCKDESKIRLLSPEYCQPFASVSDRGIIVVGVGESIGCVSPESGAGIMPSLACAAILADHVGRAEKYSMNHFIDDYREAVLDRFSYLGRETIIVKKLVAKKPLNILDLICLYRNNRKFGLYPGPKQIIRALKLTGAKFW